MNEFPPRLTVITLGTRDLPRLRAFYRGLGWAESQGSDDGWAAFALGGVTLALYPFDELAAEAAPGAVAPLGWSGITLACNVDSPEQIDTVVAAAVAAGATAVDAPVDRAWGGRSGYIADPEGNRWEIVWSPGASGEAATLQ